MSARSFADQLDAVAADTGDVPRHELAGLLRRAAVRIRSKPIVLDEATEAALNRLGREPGLTRAGALDRVVPGAQSAAGYPAQ